MARQNDYFAEAVLMCLKRQKVTQSAIAKRIGIGQSAVSMILSRQCRPQRETVKKFAKALGVAAEQLWPF
jgi:transcriptional regulator with XRE-family HTH domain